jgi:hypothetical protein
MYVEIQVLGDADMEKDVAILVVEVGAPIGTSKQGDVGMVVLTWEKVAMHNLVGRLDMEMGTEADLAGLETGAFVDEGIAYTVLVA